MSFTVTATRLVRLLLVVLVSSLILVTISALGTPRFGAGVPFGLEDRPSEVVALRSDSVDAGQRRGNSPPTYYSASAADVAVEIPVVAAPIFALGHTYDGAARNYDASVLFVDARTVAHVDAVDRYATAVLPPRQVDAASEGSVSVSGSATAAKAGLPQLSAGRSALQAKFKHAGDFGITESRGSVGFDAYGKAVDSFVQASSTTRMLGTYRGNAAILNYNARTAQVVVQAPDGAFISGWQMSPAQLQNVIARGSLGGG